MRAWVLPLFLVSTLTAKTSSATYSVLLSNIETGELGGAAVSCVGDFNLSAIFGYARTESSGVGFFTQALYSESNHEQALAWLSDGREIADVLDALTDPAFDDYAADRQYHFLPANDAGTTWTGAATLTYAGSRSGGHGPWRYTLAGNILTSEQVLALAEQSLQTATGSIEERLVAALQAGAQNSEGDSRCTPLPGDSAYLEVRDAAGVSRLRRSVVDTQPDNPLTLLREAVVPVSPSAPTAPSAADPSTTIHSDTAASPSTAQPPSDTRRGGGCSVAFTPHADGWLLSCLVTGLMLVGHRVARGGRERRP
jgi:uncharacterized Ntn-hydrolase superfamily protein